jgi:L-seryl-tRNA(Ser) seleniumtransferase
MNVFEEWGVEPVINVSGTVTRLGGAPMARAVLDAYAAAAAESVPLDELQNAASRTIAEATGAEAGIVTSGAAAGLMLGTAAILARFDLGRMEKLPHTEDFPHEFVVAREHRNGYDHAVRAAGARFVEVGFNEIVAGAGVRRTEAWEFEAAVGPNTAGILYVYDGAAQPALGELVAMAHARGLPVLVDAAGELPPRSNLRTIVEAGADLVVYSGGKAIRGPQATGILCGRRDLIMSAALQMLDMDDHFDLWDAPSPLFDKGKLRGIPRHGIGRALKVAKEQIFSLLTALKLFASGAYLADRPVQIQHLQKIAEQLPETATGRVLVPADGESQPLLEIDVDASKLGRDAWEVCRRLRRGKPRIQPGHGKLAEGKLVINPIHLNDERTSQVVRRLREELTP